MNIKTFVLAAGLVTVASSQAVAQGRTDSPNTGSGSALTSTVVFNMPTVLFGINGNGGSYTVFGPAGQVTLTSSVYLALASVVEGSTAPQPALVQAIGGGAQATALVEALQTLFSDATGANLGAAIRAYNAAVNAGPETPPAALVAVRSILLSFTEY